MNNKKSVIIIGAGLGGLASACMLAKKGYDVTILEKNDTVGGRARVFEKNGFVFDMGPSWYMMPEVFEHFFDLMGEKISDYFTLQKLSPSYRVFLKSDKSHYDFFGNIDQNRNTFEKIEPGSGTVLVKFLAKLKLQYDIAYNEFIFKNYNSIFDFLTWSVAKVGWKLPLLKNQRQIIESRFKSEILQKVLQYQMVLLGTAPGDCPGIYSMMNYVDFELGVWYPDGGMWKLPDAMEKIALKNGVKILKNSPVEQINIENNIATGVTLKDQTTLHADIVISNADIGYTDRHLLKPPHQQHSEKYWESRMLAPSAFILYLGINGKIPTLEHHNLVFSKDWNKGFDQIFRKPQWPEDPSFYISVPSKTDASVAPANCENLFVLVPIAPGLAYDDAFEKEYAEKILTEIETYTGVTDVRSRILFQKTYSIKNFISDYNAQKGTALGLAHTLGQTALFRPNNIHKKINNLFFVGASTNPGIGMPMCIISAELAYKRITNNTDVHPLKQL
ncbi:MAG: phytoene desaturase family protein [bacterium]